MAKSTRKNQAEKLLEMRGKTADASAPAAQPAVDVPPPVAPAFTKAPAANGKAKNGCPITRKQFREKAAPVISLVVDGVPVAAVRKEYDSGSLGWYANGQVTLTVDGVQVMAQVGANITIVKSKELPPDA